MSKPETIKIDDVEYVRKDSVKDDEKYRGDKKIVVVDRGFVYVGRVLYEGDFLVISSAQNIRVWGTSRGLGQLCSGPTTDTKLDNVGTVRVPMRAVISVIDVEQEKWQLL